MYPKDKFFFNGSEIKITTQYKYVGSVVSTQTRNIFGRNQDHPAEKYNNVFTLLNVYSKRAVGRRQPSVAMQMFDSQIAPIMQYMSEVWFQNKECPIL